MLANAIGVDAPMYSRIEKGERRAKPEQLEALATVLETDLAELHSLLIADKLAVAVGDTPKDITVRALGIIKEGL